MVSRRKDVECHQCGNAQMRLTNLDLEKYTSMSEQAASVMQTHGCIYTIGKRIKKMADNRRRKKRRKKKKSRKIVLFVFEILLLAILLVAAYFIGMVNRVKYENMSETEAGINDDLSKDTLESLEGYTNIAVFGLVTGVQITTKREIPMLS